MNEFKICNICNEKSVEKFTDELKKIDGEAKLLIGCQGFCGIGATKVFVIVNGIPVIGDDEEEVINRVKEMV